MSLKPETLLKLKILSESYSKELPEKLNLFKKNWDKFLTNQKEITTLQQLCKISHNLAGSAASFGFAELSESARDMEFCLEEIKTTKTLTKKQIECVEYYFLQMCKHSKNSS